MTNRDWRKKLSSSLSEHLNQEDVSHIMEGSAELDNMDENEQARCVEQIMERLDKKIPDESTKLNIMTACACTCYNEYIDIFKEDYKLNRDIDKLLELMHGTVFMVKPKRIDNIILITKAPHSPVEHAQAKTEKEKRYHFCHCKYARAAENSISLTYCYCGAGWCRKIWETVLDKPVKVEITKSVLQGDEVCQFAVFLE